MRKVNRYYTYGEKEDSDGNLTVVCEICKQTKSITEMVENNDRAFSNITYMCKNCGDSQFNKCSRCNRYYSHQCRCAPSGGLANFDSKPTKMPEFRIKDENLLYGFEFEVTSTGSREDDIESLSNNFGDIGNCKHDGSVYNGFEFVTHPMSLDWMKVNENKFLNLEKAFKKNGMIGSTVLPQTNGLHIHMSKKGFKNFHLYKFIDFFYVCFGLCGYVSERAWSNIERWSPLYHDKVLLAKQKKNEDKHVAVNLKNPFTVEIRIFKSTVSYWKFMKNVEFCQSVYDFTRIVSPKDINEANYIKFLNINVKDYPRIQKFLELYKCA